MEIVDFLFLFGKSDFLPVFWGIEDSPQESITPLKASTVLPNTNFAKKWMADVERFVPRFFEELDYLDSDSIQKLHKKIIVTRANFKMLRIFEIGSKTSLLLFARATPITPIYTLLQTLQRRKLWYCTSANYSQK